MNGGDCVSVASVSLPSILAKTTVMVNHVAIFVSPVDHFDSARTEFTAIFTDYTLNADVINV